MTLARAGRRLAAIFLGMVAAQMSVVSIHAESFSQTTGAREKHVERDGEQAAALPHDPDASSNTGIAQATNGAPTFVTCHQDKFDALLTKETDAGDGESAPALSGRLVGILMNRSVGRYMDGRDRGCAGQVLEYVPDDHAVSWRNPATDTTYTVTPLQSYTNRNGDYCRAFSTEATIDGVVQEASGSACRQNDGAWLVMWFA